LALGPFSELEFLTQGDQRRADGRFRRWERQQESRGKGKAKADSLRRNDRKKGKGERKSNGEDKRKEEQMGSTVMRATFFFAPCRSQFRAWRFRANL
jgi:hypothetical protein